MAYRLTYIYALSNIPRVIDALAALGEPNRFAIVELLRDGPLPVNGIVDRLELGQPQVSRHLKVLTGAGLVAMEPKAQQRIYHLREQRFRELDSWLDSFTDLWAGRFDRLEAHLTRMKDLK